jgi:hypothetical protein
MFFRLYASGVTAASAAAAAAAAAAAMNGVHAASDERQKLKKTFRNHKRNRIERLNNIYKIQLCLYI